MAAALAASGETSTALRPRLFQNGNERCSCVAGFCRTGRSIPLRRSQDKNLPWLPLNTSIARMHVIARIAGVSQDKAAAGVPLLQKVRKCNLPAAECADFAAIRTPSEQRKPGFQPS
jgi:hypothetical protein